MTKKMKGIGFNLAIKGDKNNWNTLTFCKLVRGQKCVDGQWYIYEETKNPKLIDTTTRDSNNNIITYVANLKELMKSDRKISHQSYLMINNKSPLLKDLKKAIEHVAKENGFKKGWKSPLKSGEEKAEEMEEKGKNGDRYLGFHELKILSKNEIQFYDKYNKPMKPLSDDELDGKYCQLTLYLLGYNPGGNKGVSAYVNMIQVRDSNPEFTNDQNPDDVFGQHEFTEEEKEDNMSKATNDIDEDGNVKDMSLVNEDNESDEDEEDNPFVN